jgi:hypothetical protein
LNAQSETRYFISYLLPSPMQKRFASVQENATTVFNVKELSISHDFRPIYNKIIMHAARFDVVDFEIKWFMQNCYIGKVI